ncbi:hypothetical protein ACEPAI_3385 [Sanghuangporus weigelae]
MKIFWHPDCLLHNPPHEIFDGRETLYLEAPSRIGIIKDALEKEPQHFQITDNLDETLDLKKWILKVHEQEYLEYLEAAYEEWVADGGDEVGVFPETFPHVSLISRRPRDPKKLNPIARAGLYCFDLSSPIMKDTFKALLASLCVVLSAAKELSSLSPGDGVFALCRPPGHHAMTSLSGGYCFINNVAVAARFIQSLHPGKSKIAILDIDYHHGDGTQYAFYDDPTVLGEGKGTGFNVNIPLPRRTTGDGEDCVSLVRGINLIRDFDPVYLLVSLGPDTHAGDPICEFNISTEGYTEIGIIISTDKRPTLFVLEGTDRKFHQPYSAGHPVPKVALKSLLDPSGATETKAKHIRSKDRKAEQEQNATEKSRSAMAKGREVKVTDPVTGEDTTIKHGGEEGDEPEDRNEGKNVLSMDYPPSKLDGSRSLYFWPTLVYLIGSLPLISRIRFQAHPYISLGIFIIIALVLPSLFAYILLFALDRKSEEDFEDHVWDAERARGLAAGEDQNNDGMIGTDERIKESAEWLSAFLRGVWPIINPDLFNSGVDMLEDIMQESSPKCIRAVRIADLGQGTNPARITSIRALPDTGVDEALKDIDDSVKENLSREHVNLEVSFAYRALPSGASASSKAHNAHLLVEFYLGISGVYEFNFPVWVELTGVSGTARARLELIPDPPFIKTTLVTLMDLPRVSISVVPMSKSLPNVMNIPVLSSFISKSIDAVCAEYVAPRSLTLDLQQLISGDDIKKATEAIGVVVIHIHRAKGLKKMDSTSPSDADSADPYVTVVYSRQGKPLYSTRIIFADLNPCYEEMAVVTVDANAVKIREKLCLQLWDSDRASADDMMGYVDIDILDLMKNKNRPSRRICPLTSPDSQDRPGHLDFTAGYYSKMRPDRALETDGSDPTIPDDLKKHDSDFQDAGSKALNDLEAAVLRTPPSPEWPSGILGIQVHEIRDLKIRMEGRETSILEKGRREGAKGQDDDGEEQEEGSNLPSSYCTISLDDNLIYSTRVKPKTSTPIFNAGTERFIRDWRNSRVSVTVRDSRMRENDPILGIVFLKLSYLFVNASEVTRFFPIETGLGHGSVRVSVLFRPVQVKLPPNLLGFDAGTLVIRKITAMPFGESAQHLVSELNSCEVKLKVSASSDKVSKGDAERKGGTVVWNEERPSEIPVRQRYGSALTVKFKESRALKSSKPGMAIRWLRGIVDNEDTTIDIALFRVENYDRLRQNYVPPDGNLDSWETSGEEVTRIGTVQLDLTFKLGLSTAHKKSMDTSEPKQKRLWEEVDRRDSVGLQEQKDAHDESQVDEREVDGLNGRQDLTELEAEGSDEDDGSDEGKGLMQKLKDWKKHEKELHRQHKGIMQSKPARTAEWIKGNVEETGQKVKNRFRMKSRQPDVETKV